MMQRNWVRALAMIFALAMMLTAVGAGAETASEAGRWELEADEIDRYLDTAFGLFL